MSTDTHTRPSSKEFDDTKTGLAGDDVVPITEEDLYIDPQAEARLVRKLDIRIAPVLAVVFLLAYLDRSNIGNAASAGMAKDIHLKGNQLNIAITLFYVTYVAAEIPGTIIMKKIRPSRFISALMTGWGAVTLASGFVDNFASLAATRLLLGLFESALFPSLALLLSQFYKPEEQGRRVSYLFVASALSGALGGFIAYGLLRVNLPGRPGWASLYVVEGAITIAAGISLYWLLPDSPEQARFLSADDKAMMAIRFKQRAIYNGNQHFEWKQVKASLTDYKLYINGCAQLCANVASFGFSTFLPTIIKGFGYSTLLTQLITAPIYIWAACVYISVAIFSDKIGKRSVFLVPMSIVVCVGYAILLSPTDVVAARLLACVLAATGIYCIVGLNITLLSSAQAPYYKRATSIGTQQAIGNSAGFIASNIYVSTNGPRYEVGATVTLSFIAVACLLYSIQWWNFLRLNKLRENLTPIERQQWIDEGREGDAHPDFRFPQ